MGLEPTTLSLGSASSAAWLGGFRMVEPKRPRSEPLETARRGWSLARNWRALDSDHVSLDRAGQVLANAIRLLAADGDFESRLASASECLVLDLSPAAFRDAEDRARFTSIRERLEAPSARVAVAEMNHDQRCRLAREIVDLHGLHVLQMIEDAKRRNGH
jgi:hypothetical protein